VTGKSEFNLEQGEAELLVADVLRDEIVAVNSHLLEIRVVLEVAKGDATGEADRVVHHDGLPAVPGVAAIDVVIVVLVASHNSPADRSDPGGKGECQHSCHRRMAPAVTRTPSPNATTVAPTPAPSKATKPEAITAVEVAMPA
jgi:hypothetical protein